MGVVDTNDNTFTEVVGLVTLDEDVPGGVGGRDVRLYMSRCSKSVFD